MSSPCLLRAAPISQPRLREVKISLKASSRETTSSTTSKSSSGGNRESTSRTFAPAEKEPPARVSLSSISRSRSTPPVNRSRAENKRSARGSGSKEPDVEHHLEKNGSLLLKVPLPVTPVGLSNISSSSVSSTSSSGTSRRQRPSHLHPHPPVGPILSSTSTSYSSPSSSSSARSIRRTRWLSYSTSNIYFNSLLEGRFRQLQGTEVLMHVCVCVCVS